MADFDACYTFLKFLVHVVKFVSFHLEVWLLGGMLEFPKTGDMRVGLLRSMFVFVGAKNRDEFDFSQPGIFLRRCVCGVFRNGWTERGMQVSSFLNSPLRG